MSEITIPIDILINEEQKKKEQEREGLRLPLDNKWRQIEREEIKEEEGSDRGVEIIKVF